ncbi:NAD(P)-binding protein [Patellaria atrata CBS 101060]|uniref:NAD(P)-binding protein n=1 Tax=Patellaria atrata CBS 101060 TaxID=1346257 RepID=A0A9P4VR75_9PEZI|nr:NAD(P)-binding protein [Patellaria atrata CBS 101060]
MPSAIVTGATGILGRQIVHELGKRPQQWPTVHALSRSKKEECPQNVVHNHIDLTASADNMAKDLQNLEGDYVFFAAYLQKETEQENWDVNGDMLENFLTALQKNGSLKKVKRVILITGCKQYGVHLGAAKNPMVESDPWLTGADRPPNFYYRQQDILKQFQGKEGTGSWDWVVTYPNDVIGYAEGNFMNLATSVGLYAAVSKELGNELVWPGSEEFYTKFDSFTSAKLHAQFVVWAALEPRAGNQAFNVVNGDAESWQNLWPKMAERYGLQVPSDQLTRDTPDKSVMDLAERPPIQDLEDHLGIKGKIPKSKVEQRIDLMKWSQKPEVKDGWQKLAYKEGLQEDAFEKATWGFLGFVLGRNYDLVVSMSKARRLGWTGYADTWDSLSDVFDELEKAKILPKRT